jgi:predicted metalloprotease
MAYTQGEALWQNEVSPEVSRGRIMKVGSIVALSLLLAVGSALADDIPGLQSKQEFQSQKASFTKALASRDDKYKELSAEDQKTVLATFDEMERRWSKADDVSGLTEADKVAMANDQEKVSTILTHAATDSRIVCERKPQIGSNLPKNVCKTVAERRRELEKSQDAARNGTLESN